MNKEYQELSDLELETVAGGKGHRRRRRSGGGRSGGGSGETPEITITDEIRS